MDIGWEPFPTWASMLNVGRRCVPDTMLAVPRPPARRGGGNVVLAMMH
jgi:hypothetical protein